jgi:hypothetical protein
MANMRSDGEHVAVTPYRTVYKTCGVVHSDLYATENIQKWS